MTVIVTAANADLFGSMIMIMIMLMFTAAQQRCHLHKIKIADAPNFASFA